MRAWPRAVVNGNLVACVCEHRVVLRPGAAEKDMTIDPSRDVACLCDRSRKPDAADLCPSISGECRAVESEMSAFCGKSRIEGGTFFTAI